MVTYKQASSDSELKQILELQQLYLPKNLSEKEKLNDGFLTVEHDFDLLKEMNDACPHTIAVDENKVIGYALSMHPKFADEIEILRPMFAEIRKVLKNTKDSIIMGQVCVSKEFRGKGIFRGLYQNMKRFLIPPFTQIITEVDTKNVRSMNAHKAIGFKELKRYLDEEKEWSLVFLE